MSYRTPIALMLVALARLAAPASSVAQPPGLAPGDSYHLIFVTSAGTSLTSGIDTLPPQVPGSWGGLNQADWTVTTFAFNSGVVGSGRLPSQPYDRTSDPAFGAYDLHNNWNFTDQVWQAVLSDGGIVDLPGSPSQAVPRDAFDRLSIQGPIYDTTGQLIASDKSTLFDGSINAPINHDESGNLISGSSDVWTGTDSRGRWDIDDCNGWTTASSSVITYVGNANSDFFLGAVGLTHLQLVRPPLRAQPALHRAASRPAGRLQRRRRGRRRRLHGVA